MVNVKNGYSLMRRGWWSKYEKIRRRIKKVPRQIGVRASIILQVPMMIFHEQYIHKLIKLSPWIQCEDRLNPRCTIIYGYRHIWFPSSVQIRSHSDQNLMAHLVRFLRHNCHFFVLSAAAVGARNLRPTKLRPLVCIGGSSLDTTTHTSRPANSLISTAHTRLLLCIYIYKLRQT